MKAKEERRMKRNEKRRRKKDEKRIEKKEAAELLAVGVAEAAAKVLFSQCTSEVSLADASYGQIEEEKRGEEKAEEKGC